MDSWSKGTTHGTSGKHPWWWRSSRRSILPPAGCREEVFLCSRYWKRGGGGTKRYFAMRGSPSGFLRRRGNIGQRGEPRSTWGSQAPWWSGQGWGRATWPPGRQVAPMDLLRSSGSFRHTDFYFYFSGIFGAI